MSSDSQVTQENNGLIRLRITGGHYAGGLVDGARILQLFSDAVTELLIRFDGDEGLMRTMESEHLAPVHAGDFLEIRANLVSVGRTSRTFECVAYKIIELVSSDESAASVLDGPVLVARATCVAVVVAEKQRRNSAATG